MAVRLSEGTFCGQDKYASPSGLFLVTVVSILCVFILRFEFTRREEVPKAGSISTSMSSTKDETVLPLTSTFFQNGDSRLKFGFDSVSSLNLHHAVFFTRVPLNRGRRLQLNHDNSSCEMERRRQIKSNNVSDSLGQLLRNGPMSLGGTIMRRGPPLYVVTLDNHAFYPNVLFSRPSFICSSASITLPVNVLIINCIRTEPHGTFKRVATYS